MAKSFDSQLWQMKDGETLKDPSIEHLRYRRRRIGVYGATIGIVHHLGKDRSKGARGAVAFMGALDTAIRVKADKFEPRDDQDVVGTVTLYCDKQKDLVDKI